MGVRIRLQRKGARHTAFFRIVAADARSPRDGRFIEQLGHYDPLRDPPDIKVDTVKVIDWFSKGAQPTETVKSLLRRVGIMQTWHEVKKGRPLDELHHIEDEARKRMEAQAATEKRKKEEARKEDAEAAKKAREEAEAVESAPEQGEAEAGGAEEEPAETEAQEPPADAQADAAAEEPGVEEPEKETPGEPAAEASREPVEETSDKPEAGATDDEGAPSDSETEKTE